MILDWNEWRHGNPRLFSLIVLAKRHRTVVGALLVVGVLIEHVMTRAAPVDLHRPSLRQAGGLMLIAIGLAIRLFALASIRKRRVLATSGAYSFCRHPLYLGTVAMALGLCVLLSDLKSFVLFAVYFALFYPLTILWEEFRLAERFGKRHEEYARTTPLFLPFGRFRPGTLLWPRAVRNGALGLIGITALLLACIEVMAEVMSAH
ncbi:MAG: isoprenylcysteine carboxylmethyltransferase family protein [Phycisphaerae bacterium]|nr:isoprenylcysteine carboxylmethyltransferase family protein [Phycisphaerae bacterium]